MFHITKTLNFIKDAKFLAVLLCSFLFSFAASAQFAATPCDPNYYKSLESRAWLEAQREITQNQNLISKPDSVLEYTCFDNHLKELAEHAEQMFSETTRWGTVLSSNSMDQALTSLVTGAFDAYDTANFSHTLLGGRIRSASGWAGTTPSETGFAYNADSTTSGGSYACDVMQAVWLKAKCMNFIDSPGNDGFHTFDALESGLDKRRFPTRCGKVSDYTTELPIALPAIGDSSPPWNFDTVDTYMDDLFPPSGCGDASGLNRVKTGLVVEDNNTTTAAKFYNEHVCLVPGCYWEPSGSGTSASSPTNAGTCVE